MYIYIFFFFHFIHTAYNTNYTKYYIYLYNNYRGHEVKIYGLLTKSEVKMAGYWPFFCMFMDRDWVEVHKLTKKKKLGQYPATLTEQAWSIENLLCGFRGKFSCRTQQIVPSVQDSSILPAQGPYTVPDSIHLACSQSWPYNKYGLLTKCEVKMGGYWPSSCLFLVGHRRQSRVGKMAPYWLLR